MTDDEIIAQISLELGGPLRPRSHGPQLGQERFMGLGRNNPRNTAQ